MAIPARISDKAPPRGPASSRISSTDTPAPASAASGRARAKAAASPDCSARTAPSAADEDTPISPGSASGLRKKPCIAAPDRPRTAPTSRPRMARGRRISCITRTTGPPSPRNRAVRLSANPRAAGPISKEAAKSTATSAASIGSKARLMACRPDCAAPRPWCEWRSAARGCRRPNRHR